MEDSFKYITCTDLHSLYGKITNKFSKDRPNSDHNKDTAMKKKTFPAPWRRGNSRVQAQLADQRVVTSCCRSEIFGDGLRDDGNLQGRSKETGNTWTAGQQVLAGALSRKRVSLITRVGAANLKASCTLRMRPMKVSRFILPSLSNSPD